MASRPRFPHERQQQMICVIQERKRVGTAELASLLDISLPTVRRDLTILEKAGLVARTHGGVVAKDVAGIAPEPLLLEKLRQNQGAKRRIGVEAAVVSMTGRSCCSTRAPPPWRWPRPWQGAG